MVWCPPPRACNRVSFCPVATLPDIGGTDSSKALIQNYGRVQVKMLTLDQFL